MTSIFRSTLKYAKYQLVLLTKIVVCDKSLLGNVRFTE